jgi:hypothetical protein
VSKRTKWLSLIGVIAALVVGWQVAAFAVLPGSGFQGNDGNLIASDGPANTIDWNSFADVEWTGTAPKRTAEKQALGWDFDGLEDAQATTSDDGFAGGTKQDNNCPAVISAKAPNKDDLKRVYFANTTAADGDIFLELAWVRIPQNSTSASAHVAFEFNQGSTACGAASDGLVSRVAGDMLIVYDFEGGSAAPTLTLKRWNTTAIPGPDCEVGNTLPCWGPPINLTTSGFAEAKVNTTPVLDQLTPPTPPATTSVDSTLGPVEFGEAGVNLTDAGVFTPGQCTSFGKAYAVSRSSGSSATAQMKDLVGPGNVNINNCGGITINKVTVPSPDPTDNTFDYSTEGGLDPATFALKDGETKDFGNEVQAGTYTVTETDANLNNFTLTDLDCTVTGSGGSTFTVERTDPNDPTSPLTGKVTIDLEALDQVDCTYTNTLQQGALAIEKDSTKGGAVSQPGAVFSFDGQSVKDNDTSGANGLVPDEDPAVGRVCVSGLSPADYTVNETTPPPGYGPAPADQADQVVTVDSNTDCDANYPTAEVANFTNAPLADIQVNFRDGGSGETSATSITCPDTGTTADTTPADGWDDSVTHEGIAIDPSPKTITCTIVIDP